MLYWRCAGRIRRSDLCSGWQPDGREAREKAANYPAIIQYHQAVNAIDKRVERGTLERAIAARAKAHAKELVSGAIADADYANGKYKEDMTPAGCISF